MITKRVALTTAAIAATLLLGLTACAGEQGSKQTDPPGDSKETPTEPSTDPTGAWIDNGRAIALVSWGSSSTACTPMVEEVKVDGQTVNVELQDPQVNAVCTRDFVPRASYIALPDGVDVSKDVKVVFSGADMSGDFTLTGSSDLAKAANDAGAPLDGGPSAGWFATDGIVLLTYGSSSCPPIVSDIIERADGATVEFKTDDTRACTADLAPRLTILGLGEPVKSPKNYTLKLSGDHLDGEVVVR